MAGPEIEALVRQLLESPPGPALQTVMRCLSTRIFPLLDPQQFGLVDYSLLLSLLCMLADVPIPERCQAAYTILTARHTGSRVPQGCAAFLGNLLQVLLPLSLPVSHPPFKSKSSPFSPTCVPSRSKCNSSPSFPTWLPSPLQV